MLRPASWPEDAVTTLFARLPDLPPCRTAVGRWLTALAIWLMALGLRWLIDGVSDGGPFLTFLPAIVLTTLLCGRLPTLVVIVLSAIASDYFWLPPPGFAMEWPTTPLSLALFLAIAAFELLLVDTLATALRANAAQRVHLSSALRLRETMFHELRHRIANQLHIVTAMLEGSQIRLSRGADASDVIEQAIGRLSSVTHLQTIVDDRAMLRRGLVPVLQDMLDQVFAGVQVAVQVRAAPVPLSADQMTIVCLIVIEAATNALKHNFRRGYGHMFAVELRRASGSRLALTVWDDGPDFDSAAIFDQSDGVGLSIMRGLAAELGGDLRLESHGGTTVTVEFANSASARAG